MIVEKIIISNLQRAIWKLTEAKELIEAVLGTEDTDQWYSGSINEMIEEIQERTDNMDIQK